jgi:two-component system, cell cycle response regulator
MATAYGIGLIGFTTFERSTFEAFFRLAARRSPSYFHDVPEAAHIVLVDADNSGAFNDARALPATSIYIGGRGREGQLGQMARPINMMALLKMLDQGVARMQATLMAPAAAMQRPVALALASPVQPMRSAAVMPPQRLAAVARRVPEPSDRDAGPKSELLVSRMDHILVVDDSDIALRFMANVLGRFGFEVHLAKSGEEALQRVAEDHFDFVFMDVTMPGIDGYQTCKLIKKRPYPAGRRAPRVVMLTGRGGMVDKMRGTLSGCDAYLTKPLQQGDLMKVIGDHVVTNMVEADTARTPLTPIAAH